MILRKILVSYTTQNNVEIAEFYSIYLLLSRKFLTILEADKDVKGGDSVEWQQRAALKRLKQYPTMKTR